MPTIALASQSLLRLQTYTRTFDGLNKSSVAMRTNCVAMRFKSSNAGLMNTSVLQWLSKKRLPKQINTGETGAFCRHIVMRADFPCPASQARISNGSDQSAGSLERSTACQPNSDSCAMTARCLMAIVCRRPPASAGIVSFVVLWTMKCACQ